jgi:hypothetical protein
MEAGLDSLGAVELRASLETKFAVEMPATVTFDYPTISSLATFIAGQQQEVRQCQSDKMILLTVQNFPLPPFKGYGPY